ncbi:hypothetical protein SLE2022_242000 [Rubroshorea leprosula]
MPHGYSAVCSRLRGNAGFWCREWQKHGRCSLFSNQLAYFNRAVELWTTYNKRIENIFWSALYVSRNRHLWVNSSYFAEEIRNVFDIHPALRCDEPEYVPRDGWLKLREVILCFDAAGEFLRDCPPWRTNCRLDILYSL